MSLNAYYDPGPLWEGTPKLTGFRIAIPNPNELAESARDTAASYGDMTDSELSELRRNALRNFIELHLSQRMLEGERVWKQPLQEDTLLSDVTVLTCAGYDADDGSWADMVIHFHVTDEAIVSGFIWKLPQKGHEIVQKLHEVGITATLYQCDDLSWSLDVPNPQGGNTIEIGLGFSNYEDALETHRKESKGDTADSVAIILDCVASLRTNILAFIPALDMSSDGFLKDLQHFQRTLSYFADSLYQVLNLQPPDIVMELSVLTELL
jgi:hypothetical protein